MRDLAETSWITPETINNCAAELDRVRSVVARDGILLALDQTVPSGSGTIYREESVAGARPESATLVASTRQNSDMNQSILNTQEYKSAAEIPVQERCACASGG